MKKVKYYDEATVREKLSILYVEGIKGVHWKVDSNDSSLKAGKNWSFKAEKKASRKRRDILISSIDEPHKSGSYLLKSFRAANKLVGNIVGLEKLKKENLEEFNVIFFIDDIIATGNQMKNNIEEKIILNKELKDFLNDDKKKIVIASIVANEEVIDELNEKYEGNNIQIIYVDPFNKDDNYFEIIKNNDSVIDDEISILKKYCAKIEKNIPFGYGEHAFLIVFCHNCPNNSLPVLWKETKDFIPLFKRE